MLADAASGRLSIFIYGVREMDRIKIGPAGPPPVASPPCSAFGLPVRIKMDPELHIKT